MSRRSFHAVLIVAGIALLGLPAASATTITLGAAASYALLAGPYINTFNITHSATVNGAVAIATNGDFAPDASAVIAGNLYEGTGVTTTNPLTVTGSTHTNYNLSQALTAAQTAASAAAALTPTTSVSGDVIDPGKGQNVTVSATGAQTVLDVSSIALYDGSLILNGTANDVFIINVTGSGGLATSKSGSVVLTGGVTASDVLFNVEASGGNAVVLNSDASTVFNGTILALNTGVNATNQTLDGAIIAGFGSSSNKYSINDNNGFVINYEGFGETPVPEPATLTLFALGVGGLLAARKRSIAP